MPLNLTFTKFKTSVKIHDNCEVLDVGSGSFPRIIEVRPPGPDGARKNAIWDGSLNIAVTNKVICHEYASSPNWRVDSMSMASDGTGKVRVSDLWESDFGAVALAADAAGNITLNGTRTLTIPGDLIHAGDTDTKISFTDDAQTFTVGGVAMLTLTEDVTQNLITLGPGSGDVDIDFNGDMFLQGSDGFLGINTTAPSTQVESADAGNSGVTVAAYSTTSTFAGQALLTLLKSHNASIGTLTETIDGERLGTITIQGVDSDSARRSTAGLRVDQVGAAGSGDVPCKLSLIAANNSAVMILDENKDVTIANGNSPTPAGQLHVDQTASGAAQPVIALDQGDVDEPFIFYRGQAASANLTRSIVNDADVSTRTLVGWTKMEIDDTGNQVADGDYYQAFYTLA